MVRRAGEPERGAGCGRCSAPSRAGDTGPDAGSGAGQPASFGAMLRDQIQDVIATGKVAEGQTLKAAAGKVASASFILLTLSNSDNTSGALPGACST